MSGMWSLSDIQYPWWERSIKCFQKVNNKKSYQSNFMAIALMSEFSPMIDEYEWGNSYCHQMFTKNLATMGKKGSMDMNLY